MAAQIIEKYLNSVRSALPEAQRDDIVQELSENLHAQIEDKENELGRPLRDADIVRNPASLLYVQALKFLQTKALPGPARRASRERRVRRATRKS